MKKRWMAAVLGICLLALAGCGDRGAAPLNKADVKETERPDLPVAQETDGTLRAGVNRFAHLFYDGMASSDNVFFSPYGICGALSLLDVGAGGETKTELERLLGIADLDTWNGQMKRYLEKDWGEKTKLLTANSLWLSPDMNRSESLEADFLQPAAFYYGSEVFEADFAADGPAVVKDMNRWVKKHTEGMIPEYKERVDPKLVMTVLNAVYFEGKWAFPFDENKTTEDGVFRNARGQEQTDIPMMNLRRERFRYVEAEGFQGIEIPYEDSGVVMDVLLPADETDFGGIERYRALRAEEREALWQSFDEAEYKSVGLLSMPRFTMDLTVESMDDILRELGMKSAYGPDADFDAIGPDIFVSAVSHRAKIEVDEQGTKAAAVTEISVAEGALMTVEEQKDFVMNRPFVFVIRDRDTGLILFMGQTADL